MDNKKDFHDLAIEMAELTCMLAQTCNEKENYFASKYGITPAEFKCLKLFIAGDPLSIKEISSHLHITPGRITHILTSLEKKEYIIRKSDENDKRNVIVHLTDKARPFIEQLSDSHLKLHKDILSNIDDDKRDDIVASMRDLIRVLKPFTKK